MNVHKNYYAIIPANIRYDDELTPNAKLLYGEITALCNEKGYCWAGNAYFSQLYGVNKVTISRWVSQLEDKGYITVQMKYKDGTNQIANRYIQICKDPINKIVNTYKQNCKDPINKIVKENNTTNNTYNNTTNILSDSNESDRVLFKNIIDYLNSKANTHYRYTTKKTKQLIKARINDGFTYEDFKTVIDKKTDDWLNNKKMAKYLRPVTLFGTNFESYLNQPTANPTTTEELFRGMFDDE